MRRTILACVITALAVGGGTATAAKLITSRDIADGAIMNRDIHKGTISFNRLDPSVQKMLRQAGKPGPAGKDGANGSNGANGANGQKGDKGDTGAAGQEAPKTVFVSELAPYGSDDGSDLRSAPKGTWAGFGTASLNLGHIQFDADSGMGAAATNAYNGLTLADLTEVRYATKYAQNPDLHGGAPYFYVQTKDADGDDHFVIFSPNTQPTNRVATDTWQAWDVTNGTVRYDDATGVDPDVSWASVIAEHGTETITELGVQAGNAGSYSDGTVAWADDIVVAAQGKTKQYDFAG